MRSVAECQSGGRKTGHSPRTEAGVAPGLRRKTGRKDMSSARISIGTHRQRRSPPPRRGAFRELSWPSVHKSRAFLGTARAIIGRGKNFTHDRAERSRPAIMIAAGRGYTRGRAEEKRIIYGGGITRITRIFRTRAPPRSRKKRGSPAYRRVKKPPIRGNTTVIITTRSPSFRAVTDRRRRRGVALKSDLPAGRA